MTAWLRTIAASVLAFGLAVVFLQGTGLANTGTPPHPHAYACWTELKPNTPYPPERICGKVNLAPSNAHDFGDRP